MINKEPLAIEHSPTGAAERRLISLWLQQTHIPEWLRSKRALAITLFTLCILFRPTLESDPVLHILGLLPTLALIGWLFARSMEHNTQSMSVGAANTLLLIPVFAILFWMLPRYIDASLTSPIFALIKFTSIPFFVGFLLAHAWPSAHFFLKGFLKANALSMLGVLAFLYTHAPIRICNSYLTSDQERLGYSFLYLALILTVAWTLPLFFPNMSLRLFFQKNKKSQDDPIRFH